MDVVAVTKCWYQWIHFCSVLVQWSSPTLLTRHPGLKMNFTDWLKSGSGVFHVVGKPGSGKSTLIKFLSTHEKTLSCLREWASRDHKELIISTFFFWKPGSEEQKTMRGLLRGLLYHMIEASPDVAQLVFPQHWANLRIRRSSMNALPAAPEFSDEEVKAAFNNLLGSDTTFARYKLCLFMDGLDEFDEPETSTSSFCCQLNEWAHRQFDVKLCVSSREYPTIIDAFRDAQRFTLQKVTVGDIARLVDDTLTRNRHFQDLELRDKPSVRGQSFRYSIVRKAEGVFLWVVLLLKWVEEDLATGSTSFDALQHIVDTAPQELEQFFSAILRTIPPHYASGAWFVFAMMLRLNGSLISRVPTGVDFEDLRTASLGLSLFGLSFVFEAFERLPPSKRHGEVTFQPKNWTVSNATEYVQRKDQATTKLQSWCKGLVEARGNRVEMRLDEAIFSHRSIPEFLDDALEPATGRLGISDDGVAEGILAASLAETMQCSLKYLDHHAVTSRFQYTISLIVATTTELSPRILKLLDETETKRQELNRAPKIPAQERWWEADEETFFSPASKPVEPPRMFVKDGAWIKIHFGALSPLLAVMANAMYPPVEYVASRIQNRPSLLWPDGSRYLMLAAVAKGTSRRYPFGASTFPSISPILRALFATEGLNLNPSTRYLCSSDDQVLIFRDWEREVEHMDEGTQCAPTLQSPWRSVLSAYLEVFVFHDKGDVPAAIWDELEVWLECGAEIPDEILVTAYPPATRVAIGFKFPDEDASVIIRPRYSTLGKKWFGERSRGFFQSFRSTTLSSIVRWHDPPNATALLSYTDRASSPVNHNTQDWSPPPFETEKTGGHALNGSTASERPSWWFDEVPYAGAAVSGLVWLDHLQRWDKRSVVPVTRDTTNDPKGFSLWDLSCVISSGVISAPGSSRASSEFQSEAPCNLGDLYEV